MLRLRSQGKLGAVEVARAADPDSKGLSVIRNTGVPHAAANEIVDLYERHALSYDADRGRELFEKSWLDRFLELVGDQGCILDLGCGCGEPIGSYFVSRGHPVTGIDSSPTLIGFCRDRFPQQSWHVGDMREVDFGRRFAGVLAWDSFFHLSPADQRAMFARFAAHALPGAALMFTSGPDFGEAIGSYRGETLYHASLSQAEYEALLADSGFELIDRVVEDATCGGHTVWLARCIGK